MPDRIQLRRSKGWRKPADAIVVARPTRWGNPYVVGEGHIGYCGPQHGTAGFYDSHDEVWSDVTIHDGLTAAQAVQLYRDDLLATLNTPDNAPADDLHYRNELRAGLARLRGHDLACWCPLDQPCHASVLLALANR